MSLTSVVNDIAAFFTPPAVNPPIPLLSVIYPHPPKVTADQEWSIKFPAGSGTGTGAVIYINIDNRKQKRIAPGPKSAATNVYTGKKWVEHQVTLLCFLRSTKPKAEDVGVDNFAFLDTLEARLLSDRNLGTAPGQAPNGYVPPGGIFQAGEGTGDAGFDIDITPGIPRTIDAQIVQVFSSVRFRVCEVITS